MDIVGEILSGVAIVGNLVCFILVVVQMFKRGQTTLGIVCIVLYCCLIGALIAFVYGWIKHREWGLTNVMIAWSCFWVLGIIGGVMHPINIQQFQGPGPVQPQVPAR